MMTSPLWQFTSYVLLAGCSLPASGAAKVWHGLCPAQIKVASVKLLDIAPEWTIDIPSGLRWHAATILASPLAMKAFLEPETYQSAKNIWADKYVLGKPDAEGNWISCSYGDENVITLAKRLDDAIRECTITYRKQDRAHSLIDASCK